MARRSGLSLTEVLVALFLMSIGVIGVLTMFPVGAVQMGTALKDQRCAEAATQADAYMRWYWRHEIVEKALAARAANPTAPFPEISEPLWNALGDPDVNPDGPSNPVFVDPMGVAMSMSGSVAGISTLPRVSLNLLNANLSLLALRTCTLLDGFTYDGSGIVDNGGGTGLKRENRYNWLWVIQRPVNRQKFNVTMTVVVFDKRIHQFPASCVETQSNATFTLDQTAVSLSPAVPELQRGGWIMDASSGTGSAGTVQLADFYRTNSVQTGGASLELQSPIRAGLSGLTTRSPNRAVHIAGVAEVFERPHLTGNN